MKRLAAMKISKSPPPSGHGFSMDNPVFEDCVPVPSSSQQSTHNAVHVRYIIATKVFCFDCGLATFHENINKVCCIALSEYCKT